MSMSSGLVSEKRNNLMPKAVLAILLILGFSSIKTGHELGDDFALFMSQAEALESGQIKKLAEENGLMMMHSDGIIGPNLYPHGYPSLLSLTKSLPGGMLIWGKIFNVILLVIGFLCFNKCFDSKSPTVWLAGIFAFAHPKVLEGISRVQADILFYTEVMIFWFVLNQLQPGWKRTFLLTMLIWFAVETRANGLFLLPTALIFDFEQQKGAFSKKLSSSLQSTWKIVVGFLILFFSLRFVMPEGSGNLWALFKWINARLIFSNLLYYLELFGAYPFWHLNTWLKLSFAPLSWLLISINWFFIIRGISSVKTLGLNGLFFITVFLGMFIIWPSQQGFRFIYPLLPFFMLAYFHGLFRTIQLKKWLVPAMAVWLIIQSTMTVVFIRKTSQNQAYSPEVKKIYTWISQNTGNRDTIVFFKPRLMYHETGRICFRQDSMRESSPVSSAFVVINDTSRNFRNRYFITGTYKPLHQSGNFGIYFWKK